MDNQKKKNKVKDWIIVVFFIVCLAVQIYLYIKNNNGIKSVSELFTQSFLLLMSFVGMLSIFHSKGFDLFVPSFILNKEEEDQKKAINTAIDAFYRNESSYIEANADARTGFIINQLGISKDQFRNMQLNMIKMRCLPLKDMNDAKSKLEKYLSLKAPFVIDMTQIEAAKRTYHDVDYFINFETVMYLQQETRRELAQIMCMLIRDNEQQELTDIDKLIIPYDSNLILGYEVGKLLGKPVVHMRKEKGRLETDKPWDGELKPTDKAIIVHDVLVSANQIMHVFGHIPTTCDVKAVYCLVARTGNQAHGLQVLEDNKRQVYSVMEVDDAYLSSIT